MKTLNIYLSQHHKELLSRLCKTYKLSMSTIADIISYWTWKLIGKNATENTGELITGYLATGSKTSIKPKRVLNELEDLENATKSKIVSNSLKIYFDEEYTKYFDEKGLKQYRENITRELKETKEDFWNYNKFTRMQWRFNREHGEKA